MVICTFKSASRTLKMESRLLDSTAISIINSPIKAFYCMTSVDLSDGELLCDLNGVENIGSRSGQVTGVSVRYPCDVLEMPYFEGGQAEEVFKVRISKSDSLESFSCSQRNSGDSVDSSLQNASLSYSDASSEALSIGSEAVFDENATLLQSSWIPAGKASDIRKDAARAVSLIDLSEPQNVRPRYESYPSKYAGKSRRSPRRCCRKSRSVQNKSSGALQDFRHELFSGKPALAHDSSGTSISKKCSDASSKCRGVWKSQSLTDNLSDDATFWKSHNKAVDVESSATENAGLTNDSAQMASTEQESTNIDQAWDEYQVPLYEAISDDSSEEKLDASCLQGDWQPLTDEFGDFSDFGNPRIALHQKKQLISDQDSDTDTEELRCLIKDSTKTLDLIKTSQAALIGSGNPKGQGSSINELLATCDTNITCLKNLLGVVDQEDLDVNDVNHLGELLAQWESVKSQLHQLTSGQELSNPKSVSDVIIDLSPDDDVTICKESDSFSTEVNLDESEPTMHVTHHTQSNGFFIPKRY